MTTQPRGDLPLSSVEDDAYRAIAAGEPTDDEEAVRTLVSLGFVDAADHRYVALDPRISAQRLLAVERAEILNTLGRMASIQRASQRLARHFEGNRMYADASEFLPCKELMNMRIGEVLEHAGVDLLTAQPAAPATRDPVVYRAGVTRNRTARERGLAVRTIYPVGALRHELTRTYVTELLDVGCEIRVSSTLPPRIVLVDGRHLFVDNHVVDAEPNAGWHITDVAAAAWAHAGFMTAWETCTPWQQAVRDEDIAITTDRQRAILRQLEQGHLQEAAASHLGLSIRAVNKELAQLRNMLQLPSTFALMAWWGRSRERDLP